MKSDLYGVVCLVAPESATTWIIVPTRGTGNHGIVLQLGFLVLFLLMALVCPVALLLTVCADVVCAFLTRRLLAHELVSRQGEVVVGRRGQVCDSPLLIKDFSLDIVDQKIFDGCDRENGVENVAVTVRKGPKNDGGILPVLHDILVEHSFHLERVQLIQLSFHGPIVNQLGMVHVEIRKKRCNTLLLLKLHLEMIPNLLSIC